MRNEIMDALLNVFKASMGKKVQKYTRRYRMITNTSMSAEMPILMLTRPKEQYPERPTNRLPPKRVFLCEIVINFADGQNQQAEPDRALCDLQDAIDKAMRPPVGQEAQTLGGLVDACYIEGEIICVPGDVDGLGMVSVPIKIIVP